MSKQATADPRIARKEMIITRNKAAQQKRQLREKDRQLTKVTSLQKSPTNKMYKNTRKNPKSPVKKSGHHMPESNNNVEDDGTYKEYYPAKLRRKFEQKRSFLKPKYESHTIAKLNKRKLWTPQRGLMLEEQQSEIEDTDRSSVNDTKLFAELSMEEVVRIVEETESLDDEDLMEILTCPSPVWWEDPPDTDYDDGPIYTRQPKSNHNNPSNPKKGRKEKSKDVSKNNRKRAKKTDTILVNNDPINIVKKDEKFLKKQSKLENILGNIKSKGTITNKINIESKKTDNSDASDKNEVLPKPRKEKKGSESTESFPDSCYDNEEMLNDLENMNIPVKNDDANDINQENKLDIGNEAIETELDLIPTENTNQSLSSNVPLNLPRLTKRPKLELDESPSIKSVSDDTELSSISGHENIDTISDTNIKFIIDDEPDPIGDNLNTKDPIKELKKEIENDDKTNVKNDNSDVLKAIVNEKKEFITVYKIVSSDPTEKNCGNKFKNIPEYSTYVENLMKQENSEDSKCYGQLNSFFKKCKFVNRKKKREMEVKDAQESFCDTCEPKKSITVAQDENVKYCLNCSSIFDTEDCSYCMKSKNCVKDEIENQT